LSAFGATTNQITTTGTGYDLAGDSTQDVASSIYSYDAENHMTGCTVSSAASSYTYDGDGYRVTKTTHAGTPGANTIVFVYDVAGKLIAEYGGPTTSSNAGISYLTTDHLGSTRVVTDSLRAVIGRHDYLPFGTEIQAGTGGRTLGQGYNSNDDTRQKFTSQERDPESGLDYYGARYCSPAQGRFTGADALAGSPRNPQSFNLYCYTLNNPLRYVDPSGNQPNDPPAVSDQMVFLPDRTIEQAMADAVKLGLLGLNWDITHYAATEDVQITPVLTFLPDLSFVAGDPIQALTSTPPPDTAMENQFFGSVLRMDGEAALGAFGGYGIGTFIDWLGTLGAAAKATEAAVDVAEDLPEVEFSASKYPELTENIQNAQNAGHPDVLTHGGDAAANRAAALKDVPNNFPGLSRDEYPFASSMEGGGGSWVGHVPVSQQHAQGAILKNFFARSSIKAGDKYRVIIGR